MKRYTLGVDLGGTNIAVGLVDEAYHIIDHLSRKTNLPRPESEVEQSIAEICRELVERNHLSFEQDILWTGIGTPGSVNPNTGIIEFNANFGYWDWHLTDAMEKLLPGKVYIENDANAAAYGEYIAGGARGSRSAVVITLGTGIGSGIILDGKIFSGFNSAGAEIGHTVIEMDGRPCMCGRKGCWEKYASARALEEDTRAALEAHKDNIMWKMVDGDLKKVNAKTAFDAMRAGDTLATELVEQFVRYVACGLINVINIFQPEIICIGGGVSREGETLMAPLRKLVDEEDFARNSNHRTKIVAAELHNDAGIIGAASLGRQNNK
ncbi:ROK family protein [uncultured Ruthenibacterium sp.]|uniref:ROK family protein n=1 Tax=uncultured Ruthenibacterium sp. TaxID=1905347 RepID=UPI00349EE077